MDEREVQEKINEEKMHEFVDNFQAIAYFAGGSLTKEVIQQMTVKDFFTTCFNNGLILKVSISKELLERMRERGLVE